MISYKDILLQKNSPVIVWRLFKSLINSFKKGSLFVTELAGIFKTLGK